MISWIPWISGREVQSDKKSRREVSGGLQEACQKLKRQLPQYFCDGPLATRFGRRNHVAAAGDGEEEPRVEWSKAGAVIQGKSSLRSVGQFWKYMELPIEKQER